MAMQDEITVIPERVNSSVLGIKPRVRVHIVSHEDPSVPAFCGDAKIFFDEFQVYGFPFGANNVIWAIRRCESAILELRKLPVEISGRESIENLLERRIYYREQPAIIEHFEGNSGELRIRCDNDALPSGGKYFQPEPWQGEDAEYPHRIDVDILSPFIHWER